MNVERPRIVVLLALICLATGCTRREPAPPQPDLSALDPRQAALIEASRSKVLTARRSAEAWGNLGQVLDAVDLDRHAMECYEQARDLDPRSARWPYLLGLRQLRDDSEEGLKNLGRAADLGHGTLDAPRLRLVQALIERGQFDEASRHLEKLFAVHPEHPAGRVELARVHMARDELDPARVLLEPCLTNAHTARPALFLLANVAQARGDSEMALMLARHASQLPRPPSWPDPFLDEIERLRRDRMKLQDHAHRLLTQGRLVEAESVLVELFKAYPEDAEGLLLLGRLRTQQRRCPEAESTLREYLTSDANSINGRTQLALALICQEKWAEAAVLLEQVVALKPDFAQAHGNLAYARARLGDSAGAIAAYRAALRSTPGDVGVHRALADELSRAGRAAEAAAHLQRARQLDPNDPRVGGRRE